MNRVFGTLIGIVVVAVLFRACAFIVDQRQFGLVFAFGQLKEVISEPGLQFKLPPPFQNVVYLDKRILTIDTPQPDRVQTSEKRNLLIDSFVKWRISDPRRYWVSFLGSERAAQDRINSLVRDSLNQAALAPRTSRPRQLLSNPLARPWNPRFSSATTKKSSEGSFAQASTGTATRWSRLATATRQSSRRGSCGRI